LTRALLRDASGTYFVDERDGLSPEE